MQRNADHYSKILDFSKKSGIPVGLVMQTIEECNTSDLDNADFTAKIGISKVSLSIIKKELSAYFIPVNNKNQLSDFGKMALEQMNRQIQLENILDREKIMEILSHRLDPERNYDQFLATKETVIERIRLMDKLGDLRQKKLLFLGDDDFTSVLAGIYGDTAEISVLEIDKRITTEIRKFNDKYNLKINVILHDLRKNIPVEFLSKFDVVFFDPPYSSNGMKLFLSRAIQTLDFHNKASRIYMCYGNSDLAREKFVEIQKIIAESGLMTRYIYDKFNRYSGAESIGNSSSLYICDSTPSTKPVLKGPFNGNIYTIN